MISTIHTRPRARPVGLTAFALLSITSLSLFSLPLRGTGGLHRRSSAQTSYVEPTVDEPVGEC